MRPTRREFLQAGAATAAAGTMLPGALPAAPVAQPLDAFQIAKRHQIVRHLPTPDFFEGMLLGNGDIGVCVTVRPDALGLHLGKEDSWDIRMSEDHYQYVPPFNDLLKLWERAGEEAKRQGKPDMTYLESNIDFFREYAEKVTSSTPSPGRAPGPAALCGFTGIRERSA